VTQFPGKQISFQIPGQLRKKIAAEQKINKKKEKHNSSIVLYTRRPIHAYESKNPILTNEKEVRLHKRNNLKVKPLDADYIALIVVGIILLTLLAAVLLLIYWLSNSSWW
jgi:hypothetical protein